MSDTDMLDKLLEALDNIKNHLLIRLVGNGEGFRFSVSVKWFPESNIGCFILLNTDGDFKVPLVADGKIIELLMVR